MTQVKGTLKKEGSSGLMSAEELKLRLQQHFAKSGTLNNLKTQLRNQLVTELFRVAELPTNKLEKDLSDAEARKTLLPLQVSNWLVYDHLKRQGYDYSLSTFVTEASISFPEKLLSLRDVLDLLGFKSESEENETIREHYVHCRQGSFLHSLLLCVMKQHKKHDFFDLDCNEKKNSENIAQINDGTILGHQQLYLNGSWTEQENKIARSKFSGDSQNDLKLHEQKLHQIKQSEKEKCENEVQRLRQKLLYELDRLYEHEQQVRLELEQRRSHLTREQELLDVERNKLRVKELELAKHSSHIGAENEKIYQLKEETLSATLKKKDEEFAELGERLKQQEHRLSEERDILNHQKKEIEELRNQLQESERNCRHIQNEYSTLLAENAVLKGKVENTTDYEHIKMELLNNLKEAESFRMEIKEIKEKSEAEKNLLLSTVKNLEEQLKICIQKNNNVKEVGVSTETSYFQDKSMWNQQKDRLEQELGETKQLFREVLQKLQEQNEDIQDLHVTLHFLHNEISDTTNRSKNAPKTEDPVSRPVPAATVSGPDVRPSQLQRTFLPHTQQSYNIQYPGLFYPSPVAQKTHKDDPYKFISEARKRISDLEQEAQAVKRKYSVFVASQMKIPPPSYIAYRNTFNNYDSIYTNNQDYQILRPKGSVSSLLHPSVTDKHGNNLTLSFSGDPHVVTPHNKNNEKALTHHDLTVLRDVELARNYAVPHDRHVHFQNDEHFVSHRTSSSEVIPSNLSSSSVVLPHNPVQESHSHPNNKINSLHSHVEIMSNHKHPIFSDSTSVSVSQMLPQHLAELNADSEKPLVTMTTANVTSPSHSSETLRHSSTDHPFHLSKFGLYSTGNKTVTSPPVIAHNQIQSYVSNFKSQNENLTEQNDSSGENVTQVYPKISNTSTLNSKNNHVNYISSTSKPSLSESRTKLEISSEQGEASPSLQNHSADRVSVSVANRIKKSEEQMEKQFSNHSVEPTEQVQIILDESSYSERDNLNESCIEISGDQMISLKPSKSIDSHVDIKKLGDEIPSVAVKQHFQEIEGSTSVEIGGAKPKNNAPPRRLSVDLDSAWRQQAGSMPSVVENFMRPRSGSSHSLPSRFSLAETAVEPKSDIRQSQKHDDISSRKEVSSPRSHSFSETHLTEDVEKINHHSAYNANDTAADGMEIIQPSEDLGNLQESVSDNSNSVDEGNIKNLKSPEKCISTINLGSVSETKHSSSSDVIGKEKELHVNGDSVTEVMHEEHVIKKSEDESDHDSLSNVKSLPRMSQENVEISVRDVSVPSEFNVDAVPGDILHEKKTEPDNEEKTVLSASESDSHHHDSGRRGENETGPTKDPQKDVKSATEDSGSSHGDEQGLDESASELSELNLSAGNEKLEESKSEESGW